MSLTPRENLLRLWRREGFEDSPAFFNLCPSLIEEFKRRYGCAQSYQDQFNIPFRGVSTIAKDNKHDWMKYYPARHSIPGQLLITAGLPTNRSQSPYSDQTPLAPDIQQRTISEGS